VWMQPEPHAAGDFASFYALAQPLRKYHGPSLLCQVP
jgi:hypothetical protein